MEINKVEVEVEEYVHIQIPPTGYVSLILRSTTVAIASQEYRWGYYEGTLQLLHAQ